MATGNVMQYDSIPHEHSGMPPIDGCENVSEGSTKLLYTDSDVQQQWYAALA
jgi:hypothetical protein